MRDVGQEAELGAKASGAAEARSASGAKPPKKTSATGVSNLRNAWIGGAITSLALAACDGGSAGSSGAAAALSSPTTTASAAPAPKAHVPKQRAGSAVALSDDGQQVFVADEVHEVVFVAPSTFGDLSGVRVVPMPGPPAQIVVANDLVLASVRTLPTDDAKAARDEVRGPLPEASKVRRLAPGLPDFTSEYELEEEWGPYLLDAPAPLPLKFGEKRKPSAPTGSARASASPAASASATATAASKIGTPPKPFDPSVVRKSQGGLLVLLKPDAARGLAEVGRVVLPPDAWGLSVTPDGKRAVVTSAWTATVSIVDLDEKKVIASLPVSREPRGIAITGDGKTAYISHLVGSDLTKIDDLDGAPKAKPLPLPTGLSRGRDNRSLAASLGWSLALSADGRTLFVPRHAIGTDGTDAWWGSPVLDLLHVKTEKPLIPPRRPGSPIAQAEATSSDFWNQTSWSPLGAAPSTAGFIQPRATLYRKKTDTVLIASEARSVVVELDARTAEPTLFPVGAWSFPIHDRLGRHAVRGGGASAMALSDDEDTLFVFCRTTFDLVRVNLRDKARQDAHWLRLGDDPLPEDARRGRLLFTDSTEGTVSGGVGCETCHPEGRDDGYVWRHVELDADAEEPNARFVGLRENVVPQPGVSVQIPAGRKAVYPRQTPMIAGRTRANGPYGWHAEAKTIVERLDDGFRLHRSPWNELPKAAPGSYLRWYLIDTIADYVRSGLLPPPTLARDLSEEEKKGKTLFESAATQCTKCHDPQAEFTDRLPYPYRGPQVLAGFDPEKNNAFKTPSLFFVGGTAPYFHDGSAATLEELVKNNGMRMGNTSHLSPEEQASLVAYLKTL